MTVSWPTVAPADHVPLDAESRWVGMREACRILGVHSSTLRQWSDSGRIPVFLTPGGHRRYSEAIIRALTEREDPAAEPRSLATLLLGSRAHYAAVVRRLARSSPWIGRLDRASRRRFHRLGSSMLRLLTRYMIADDRRERERCLRQGRDHAAEYGALAAGLGLSLTQMTEAFLLYRRPVQRTVQRWLRGRERSGPLAGDAVRRADTFLEHMLLSFVSAYDRHRAGRDAPPGRHDPAVAAIAGRGSI